MCGIAGFVGEASSMGPQVRQFLREQLLYKRASTRSLLKPEAIERAFWHLKTTKRQAA